MAVTVTPTVGASDANAYASVVEGDAFFEGRSGVTAWTGASADEKGRALILATERIDQEEFVGSPVSPLSGTSSGTTQALKWPRYSAQDDEGWTYESDVIPERVKKATLELALEVLGGGVSLTDSGLEGFEDVKVGPLSVTPRHERKAGTLPAQVLRYLRPLLTTPSSLTFPISRS